MDTNLKKEILRVYNTDPGYKIKKTDSKNKECYIYCSSNALYRKGDLEDFEKIIEMDRYEWEHIMPNKTPELEIYIRDIFLSWYVNGINDKINNYEKLIEFLKKQTYGYKVRCIGASSGGYIGTMIAMSLGGGECISFAGQFSLCNHFDHVQTNEYLRMYIKKMGKQGLELQKKMLNSLTDIYYICPIWSKQDNVQKRYVQHIKNVHIINVMTSKHGVAMFPYALPKFISLNKETFIKYSKTYHDKFLISCQLGGWIVGVRYLGRKLLRRRTTE